MKAKRGDRVKVEFEGVVVNRVYDFACEVGGVRVSVKNPDMGKESWWAVVPLAAITSVKKRSPKMRSKIMGVLAALVLATTAQASTFFPIPTASTTDHPNTGYCRVTPYGESSVNRTIVFCRYSIDDLTGDGQGEVAETRIILRPNGKVDCALSAIRVLDLTRGRNQDVIPIQAVCK